jgi:hypothetical protein
MPEPTPGEEQLFTLKPLHVLLFGAGILSSGKCHLWKGDVV